MRKLIYSMTASLDGYIADRWRDRLVGTRQELLRFHTQQVQEIGVHLWDGGSMKRWSYGRPLRRAR